MTYRALIAITVTFYMGALALSVGAETAHAEEPKYDGLAITPLIQDVTVKSGHATTKEIEVANYSNKNLTVSLEAKEFSTADYTYDFAFYGPVHNWIRFNQNQIVLQPGQVAKIEAVVDVPAAAASGSYHFAVFASADMSTTGFKQTARITSLVMVRVEGKWIETGTVDAGHVPFLNFDTRITYRFDAENTGNVYYSIVVFGQIESLFGVKGKEQGAGHVLIPGAKRAIEGSVAPPLWPGIYKMTYGYTKGPDSEQVARTVIILFVPPWAIVVLLLGVVVGVKVWQKRRRTKNKA